MPVAVSLEQLVTTPTALPLWPEKFRELVSALEERPDDANAWLVVADWLQEHDERELESACRWFARHAEVTAERDYEGNWRFKGLPLPLEVGVHPPGDRSTLAGAVATLAARIRRAKEALA